MVGHVALVGLQEIVIHVLHRDLGTHPVQAERLQFQHDHGSGGVLGQRLIDAQPDLRARPHLPLNQMWPDQLLRNVAPHTCHLAKV